MDSGVHLAKIQTEPRLRAARPEDLLALLALEDAAFTGDRISRRSFRQFLTSPHAEVIVAEAAEGLVGCAVVLFRPASSVGRLYSIAVAVDRTGRGLGKRLLAAAEETALRRNCLSLRLEVDERNTHGAALYKKSGYTQFARRTTYYEGGGDALRFEKRLSPSEVASHPTPPYFHQTTEFTCGPACMLMALAWAGHAVQAGAALEFKLWREATAIFLGSSPGGCEPLGLAVALRHRGLVPEVFVSHAGPYLTTAIRSVELQRVTRLAQDEFRREADELGIPVHLTPLDEPSLMKTLSAGGAAIMLVAGYRMLRRHVPHWVFAYGRTDRHVLVHDPEGGGDSHDHAAGRSMAIPLPAFARWSRFGSDDLRAAIVIRKGLAQ